VKVAIYARVSTADKDQNAETQLLPLREYVEAQRWEVYDEYVDQAPANDLAHRTAWRRLLDDAAKKKFSIVLVFKLDRAYAEGAFAETEFNHRLSEIDQLLGQA